MHISIQGPMMRAPHMQQYMQHSGHGGAQRMNAPYGSGSMGGQRPPNVQIGPDGMPMNAQEWRQLVMSQQQTMNFNGGNVRPGFNPNHQGKISDSIAHSLEFHS